MTVSIAVQGPSYEPFPSPQVYAKCQLVFFCGVVVRVCAGLGRYMAVAMAAARNFQRSFLLTISPTMLAPNTNTRCDVSSQMTLRARSESLPLLTELRSEALKDRHWRPLLRRLGIRVGFQELNLGLLWGSALMGHKKGIGEMVLAAQGEMALEEFLRQVRRLFGSLCFVLSRPNCRGLFCLRCEGCGVKPCVCLCISCSQQPKVVWRQTIMAPWASFPPTAFSGTRRAALCLQAFLCLWGGREDVFVIASELDHKM